MSHSSHDKEKTDHIDVEKENVEQPPHLRLQHIHDASGVQKVVTVKNAALAAATTQGALRPFSKESFILYWSCFIAFLCSCANGYDGSLMTSINSMPQYQDKFKTGTLGDTVALVFSLYNIGGIVGPWFAGPLTDRFGRRGGMFIGAWIIVIGTIIAATSEHLNQFMAGRFILGFGVSILTCAAPSYIIEVSPPQWRGRMTGLYNCGWFGGSIPAAGITLGTQAIAGDMAWRLPLIFQAVPSGVVILAVWFLPESPRWQIANGQDERAMAFLTKYHGNGDPTNPVVELEWKEFKNDIKLDASDKRWWDYSELVKTRGARWRSLMVLMMGVFGQFSGNGLGYFNQQIYEAVGYSTYDQFVLNLGNNFTSCGGAIAGVALADKMSRRKVLIIGTFLSGLMLAANGGLSTKWSQNAEVGVTDLNVGRAAVAFYFFFGIIYSFSYTPLQALYPVECLNTATRAKGMAMYGVVVGLFGFINTYAGPIALKNIREKYVYIFVAWDMVESFLWWLLGIETNGRSLEQLEAIFSSKNPVKASKQTEKLAVKQDGALAVVDE